MHAPPRSPMSHRQMMSSGPAVIVLWLGVAMGAMSIVATTASAPRDPFTLSPDAERWVQQTMSHLSVDEKVGQLIVPGVESGYLSTDSDAFETLSRLVRDYHVSGFHVFGSSQPAPSVLLNAGYGTVILGQPMTAAFLLDRLQALSSVPLLNSADFETGLGFRLSGATTFPRQMAMGAIPAGDDVRLVKEEARITALEAKAIGVQVNFAPVADVNDNPRNPVINTRSYGEDPAHVAALVSAYLDGARAGGMIATLKHFPGHGDTDVDSHLGLPIIRFDRPRLGGVELVPFRRGIEHGAEAIMAAHIVLPALDPAPASPATFSRPVLHDLLREELGFQGLVYTDSMSMDAITKIATPGEAAVRAVVAGADQVLHSPDPIAAVIGLRRAVADGLVGSARLDDAVGRVLRAKASVGLHTNRTVDLNAVPDVVGGRQHEAVAREASAHSLTLIRDDRRQVPFSVARDTPVLYLSVLDYPSGWQISAPSRTFIPELKKHWPQVTAVEVSDRTSPSDLDLVRSMTTRFGAVVASVFVRAASGSGRLDLPAELARLLNDIGRQTIHAGTPFVVVCFGNPYVASVLADVPAILLTYDFYDLAEASAVRAIAGDAPIGGHLPVALPGLFPVGHGLVRTGH